MTAVTAEDPFPLIDYCTAVLLSANKVYLGNRCDSSTPGNSQYPYGGDRSQAPPPPKVAFEGSLLIEPAVETPTADITAKVEEPAAQELPKTGSPLPLIGLASLVLLAGYVVLRIARNKTA